eukprot:2942529-Rhodomonas_salina.1
MSDGQLRACRVRDRSAGSLALDQAAVAGRRLRDVPWLGLASQRRKPGLPLTVRGAGAGAADRVRGVGRAGGAAGIVGVGGRRARDAPLREAAGGGLCELREAVLLAQARQRQELPPQPLPLPRRA